VTFQEVLTEAVNEFIRFGFDNQERLDYWIKELRQAAVKSLVSEDQLRRELEKSLKGAYDRLVTKGGLVSKDVSRFTVDRLTPKLRQELDRRIMASANLIKLNREESISNTLRRFAGWATSIPPGGSKVVDRREEKKQIKKDLGLLPFKERRVIIDQTHKLINNIKEVVAMHNLLEHSIKCPPKFSPDSTSPNLASLPQNGHGSSLSSLFRVGIGLK